MYHMHSLHLQLILSVILYNLLVIHNMDKFYRQRVDNSVGLLFGDPPELEREEDLLNRDHCILRTLLVSSTAVNG